MNFTYMNYKKTRANAICPERMTDGAAGYDLRACIDEPIIIQPNETKIIDTGIAIELQPGTFGAIYSRSGLAIKQGLYVQNGVGVIDEDYRNSIKVALHNNSNEPKEILPEMRIAQLVIQPYIVVNFQKKEELNTTKRNLDGLGSTGQK